MRKPLQQVAALLLLPCLVADPALSSLNIQEDLLLPTFSQRSVPIAHFQEQALTEPVIRVLKSIRPKPMGAIQVNTLLKIVPLMRSDTTAASLFTIHLRRLVIDKRAGRANFVRDLENDLYSILRKDVPKTEKLMNPFMEPLWEAIQHFYKDFSDVSIINPDEFMGLALIAIEQNEPIRTKLRRLKRAVLQRHRYVLDTSYVHSLLSGEEQEFYASKLFRPATANDRLILISGLDQLIGEAIEGIRLELIRHLTDGDAMPSTLGSEQTGRVMNRTQTAHGQFDEAALRTGGVPLMKKTDDNLDKESALNGKGIQRFNALKSVYPEINRAIHSTIQALPWNRRYLLVNTKFRQAAEASDKNYEESLGTLNYVYLQGGNEKITERDKIYVRAFLKLALEDLEVFNRVCRRLNPDDPAYAANMIRAEKEAKVREETKSTRADLLKRVGKSTPAVSIKTAGARLSRADKDSAGVIQDLDRQFQNEIRTYENTQKAHQAARKVQAKALSKAVGQLADPIGITLTMLQEETAIPRKTFMSAFKRGGKGREHALQYTGSPQFDSAMEEQVFETSLRMAQARLKQVDATLLKVTTLKSQYEGILRQRDDLKQKTEESLLSMMQEAMDSGVSLKEINEASQYAVTGVFRLNGQGKLTYIDEIRPSVPRASRLAEKTLQLSKKRAMENVALLTKTVKLVHALTHVSLEGDAGVLAYMRHASDLGFSLGTIARQAGIDRHFLETAFKVGEGGQDMSYKGTARLSRDHADAVFKAIPALIKSLHEKTSRQVSLLPSIEQSYKKFEMADKRLKEAPDKLEEKSKKALNLVHMTGFSMARISEKMDYGSHFLQQYFRQDDDTLDYHGEMKLAEADISKLWVAFEALQNETRGAVDVIKNEKMKYQMAAVAPPSQDSIDTIFLQAVNAMVQRRWHVQRHFREAGLRHRYGATLQGEPLGVREYRPDQTFSIKEMVRVMALFVRDSRRPSPRTLIAAIKEIYTDLNMSWKPFHLVRRLAQLTRVSPRLIGGILGNNQHHNLSEKDLESLLSNLKKLKHSSSPKQSRRTAQSA
jgi:hypothetical protein